MMKIDDLYFASNHSDDALDSTGKMLNRVVVWLRFNASDWIVEET